MDNAPHAFTSRERPRTGPPQDGKTLPIVSLALAILSFVACGPVFSIPAIILGRKSLARMECGAMPRENEGLAKTATILGYVNLAVFALSLVFMAAFLFVFTDIGSSAIRLYFRR